MQERFWRVRYSTRHSVFLFLTALSKDLLAKSRFASDISLIENCFDKTTKLSFRNADEPQFVRFGTTRDTDPSLKIRSGQLRLLGYSSPFSWFDFLVDGDIFLSSDVASFFEPSLQCIVKAINEHSAASTTKISVSYYEWFQVLKLTLIVNFPRWRFGCEQLVVHQTQVYLRIQRD